MTVSNLNGNEVNVMYFPEGWHNCLKQTYEKQMLAVIGADVAEDNPPKKLTERLNDTQEQPSDAQHH